MKKSQIWVAMGVTVGIVFGKMLAPYMIYETGTLVMKSTTNPVTSEQVKSFISDTIVQQVIIDSIEYEYTDYHRYLTNIVYNKKYTFYNSSLNKYFAVQYIDNFHPYGSMLNIAKKENITYVVNKQQLQSNFFGTRENPVYIIKCYVPVNPNWSKSDKGNAQDIIAYNDSCIENTKKYLTYFVPKKEFQKMFGEEK